ncbi:DUF4129 domain-containing protein [Homoserinimonas hongtaonis]|uniref:DUF4129 domain-containing protein n=1 Tax=Homoserinimonas hongtaonis TaxID=2079791 RepID=A0A2U1SWS5_9MICO|nr:DUF4129 domain-containing protein [Salinibacterium hongtaonis]PWB96080.1 DUF4129 domain-containing protein [Salinibacterium hongtaonis]
MAPAHLVKSEETPLTPDREEAREWVLGELSRREYQESKPSWFDQLAADFWDWLTSLEITATDGQQGIGLLLLTLAVAAVIVTAFIVFGRPALARRTRISATIFGDDDARTAAQMRSAAQSAAAQGRWSDAVLDLFRAMARDLAHRAVVTIAPGTTAQAFSARASSAFPASTTDLAKAAEIFDSVRYLDHEGTREQYDALLRLDQEIQKQKPLLPGHDRMTAGAESGGRS